MIDSPHILNDYIANSSGVLAVREEHMAKGKVVCKAESINYHRTLLINTMLRNTIVMFCVLMIASGCNHALVERGTQVTIVNDGMPPSFKLSGNGIVARIFFNGPYDTIETKEIEAKLGDPAIWEIDAPRLTVDELPILKYGSLSPGFTQIKPSSGPPPNLIDGKCYRLTIPTIGAPGGGMHFCIRNGKAEKVRDPD
jgi:hypothetical protein